jgi:adenosine kinase
MAFFIMGFMLIITGTVAYDYIMDFPGAFGEHILPEQIHNINLSFIVNNFERRRGGTAGNASYSLGLLNTPHILFSVAGKDFAEYEKIFKKMGIETKHVLTDKKTYTATGFAMTDKTNNQIWGYFYGAAEKIPDLKLNSVAKKGDLVLIGPSGAKGSLSFVKQCIAAGIDYMFDPGFILTQVSDEELTLGVKHAKYLIGNDYEINLIKTRVKDFQSLAEQKIVITTLAERGATVSEYGEDLFIPPVKADKVVDPTGAGDSWRSGFLAGLERGFDLVTSGRMGAVIASFVVEKYGTQEHTFTKSLFTKRYQATYNQKLEF